MSMSYPQIHQVIYSNKVINIIHVSYTDNINSSIIPCNMTEAYPITIGLHIVGDCSELQVTSNIVT